jgi:hypothetical protein
MALKLSLFYFFGHTISIHAFEVRVVSGRFGAVKKT